MAAITIKEGDELVSVSLVKEEQIILITEKGMCIRMNSTEFAPASRTTMGLKGITLNPDDKVITALPIRNNDDKLAIFSTQGLGKKFSLSEIPAQKRAGKGLICYKAANVSAAALVEDTDSILILGDKSSICISASEIPEQGRASAGNQIIKNSNIISVSKV